MTTKRLTGVDIAGLLKWSEGKVSKLLTGRTELGVDELDALCFAVGISITEAVRDHGLEFCAEMTPTELRVLEALRASHPATLGSVAQLLNVRNVDPARAHEPSRRKKA